MLGRTVNFVDGSGNIKPAMITRVFNAVTGLVQLTVFEAGATLTNVASVALDANRAPNTWHYAPEGV